MQPVVTKKNNNKPIVVTLMRAVAAEMGQYTLPYCIVHSFIKSDC